MPYEYVNKRTIEIRSCTHIFQAMHCLKVHNAPLTLCEKNKVDFCLSFCFRYDDSMVPEGFSVPYNDRFKYLHF